MRLFFKTVLWAVWPYDCYNSAVLGSVKVRASRNLEDFCIAVV